MTEIEQALVPTLGRLRRAPAWRLTLNLIRGLAPGDIPREARDKLERLGLDRPNSIKDMALRAVVLGAMRGS
jgi:hypothetical protein